MKATNIKPSTPAQRKHAAELEAIRMEYYEENRILRNDLASRTRHLDSQNAQINGLKAIVADQQLNISVLLEAIRRGARATEVNAKQAVGQDAQGASQS